MSEDRVVELRYYYKARLFCPFCGAATTDDQHEFTACRHMLFTFHSELGFMAINAEFEALLTQRGFSIDRSSDLLEVTEPGEEAFWDYDPVEMANQFPDVIVIKQEPGPPAMEHSYTAFAVGSDESIGFE